MLTDWRVLAALVRGQRRSGSHAERLEAFYAPQAERYDAFRERLLWGRDRLVQSVSAGISAAATLSRPDSAIGAALSRPDSAIGAALSRPESAIGAALSRSESSTGAAPDNGIRIVELGAGTGRTAEFFGPRLRSFASVELVDLCPSLLARAKLRARAWPNVRVIEADAARYRPAEPVDAVYFSYALSMMPGWRDALDNGIRMLKPGGILGIVDFYIPDGYGRAAGMFWRRWFGHDGVRLSIEPLLHARAHVREEQFVDERAGVPCLPGLKVPV